MGAKPEGNKSKLDAFSKQPGRKRRKRNARHTAAEYAHLAAAYILTGSQTQACIDAGFSPHMRVYIFAQEKVQKLIKELRPEVERRVKEKAINSAVEYYEITSDFLDSQLAHLIANGPTHFMRGDGDKIKGIEVGYKRLRLIEPAKVVANAQAGAIAGRPATTFIEVYRSRWLIEKEQKMREQLERENAIPKLKDGTHASV